MNEHVCEQSSCFSQCVFFSQQLHMGKQAEEQQKYGERVGPKIICSW